MTIDEYILQHIDDEGDYLKALYRDTHVKLLYPRMASGHLQGRMLKMFVRMIRPRQVLEIGVRPQAPVAVEIDRRGVVVGLVLHAAQRDRAGIRHHVRRIVV